LKKSILDAWALISQDGIKKLYDTIPNRIFATIRANGGSISGRLCHRGRDISRWAEAQS